MTPQRDTTDVDDPTVPEKAQPTAARAPETGPGHPATMAVDRYRRPLDARQAEQLAELNDADPGEDRAGSLARDASEAP